MEGTLLVYGIARQSYEDLLSIEINGYSGEMRRQIIRTAQAYGYTEIWLDVFKNDADMVNRLQNL